ncbi:MAG: alanine racemase [Clostridia bacterium]|nr:alanine racemase [Clostridia bacterium]
MKDRYISKRKRFWAEIDVNAAEKNFNIIKSKLSKGTRLCCVVKANAYGHGAVYLSKLYERLGADFFAVSNIEEAMQLRNNGIVTPILILGYTPASCASILAENNISQTVFSYSYARELSKCARADGVNVKIHIKLDSGMGRIGFDCIHGGKEITDTVCEVCSMDGLLPEGIFTHFAVADEGVDGRDYTRTQYERFTSAVDEIEKGGIAFEIKHCANSATTLEYPEYHMDMVRVGVVLYGVAPSLKVRGCEELSPVMSLKSVISMIKEIEAGDTVSYGCTFKAEKKTKIATAPVGYADGFWRSNADNGTQLLIRGQRVNIVGRVCMDQLMLDVTDVKGVREGDYITVIGSDKGELITADELAKRNGTIGYEMICSIGERVPRFYIRDHEIVFVKDNIVSYEIAEQL